MAQRSLNFSQDESLICSRTRSKCPLTDTPLEHLEMAFEPPDITADMYDTEVDDEDWGKFLLDLSKPTDAVKQAEDDERIDPEYNLMADTDEKCPSIDELREEFRGDRAVRISKREVHELVTDTLSCLESEDEDQDEEEVMKKTSSNDDSNNLNALTSTVMEESILINSALLTSGKMPCISKSLQQENQVLIRYLGFYVKNILDFILSKEFEYSGNIR
ncbi:GON-4-like protein [Armadillidium nasatum]|uniref:GON-4-like protein n=1 Tax=Armadillidium nasatum TaxID=96803 RepID=A0A5N5T062_9CRUS|nr:GON-4-like protein [Armadillidium nasatum]